MRAEVTLNRGHTYRFSNHSRIVFRKNKTQIVKDPALVRACQATAGFSVRVIEEAKPERVMRKAAATTTTRKKKSKKKRRRVVDDLG